MSKTYKTEAAAKTAATKLRKSGVVAVAMPLGDAWTVETSTLPPEPVEAEDMAMAVDAAVDAGEEWPSQQLALSPGWQVIEADDAAPEAPLNDSLKAVPARKTVTLSFPLTTVSATYVGALHEGREVWFDKKSLEAFELDVEAKMVTVTMERSKAVRRRFVQPAA